MGREIEDVFGPSAIRVVEITIFVPSADRDGRPIRNQKGWRDRALGVLGDVFGGATALGPADGVWKNPQTGQLVRDKPILVYTYVSESDAQDASKLTRLREFCEEMGKKTRQGEVGLKIGQHLMYIPTW